MQRVIAHLKEQNYSYFLIECHLNRMPSRFSMIFAPRAATLPYVIH